MSGPARLRTLLLLGAVVCGACRGDRRPAPGVVVRDSAGVRIVENPSVDGSAGAAWRVSGEPVLSIGEAEGAPEYQLHQVRGARRLRDGRIVVANGGPPELRFYSADGRFLSAAGRRGNGPGEYQGIAALWVVEGDSLLVYDFGNGRISRLGPSGEYARSFRIGDSGSEGTPIVRGRFADGGFLVTYSRGYGPNQPVGIVRDSTVLARFHGDGSYDRPLGRFFLGEALVWRDGDRVRFGAPLFGRWASSAVAGDGFYYGTGERYEIGWFGADGTLARLVRREGPARGVTRDDVRRVREADLSGADSPAERARIERRHAATPVPATMPAYGRFVVDDGGNLWVAEYDDVADAVRRWSVFDPEGRLAGTVSTPGGFEPYEIGDDYLLGLSSDTLGVERVRMYRLVRAARRAQEPS